MEQKKCANGVVVPMIGQNQVRETSFLIVRKNASKRQKERDNLFWQSAQNQIRFWVDFLTLKK